MINEGWNAKRHYWSEMQELFNRYKYLAQKHKDKEEKAKAANKFFDQEDRSAKVLAKYPVQIIIDKAGYSPKKILRFMISKGGEVEQIDKLEYGKFLVDQIESGKLKLDDMVKWWNEYDSNIAKEKFFNVRWLAKQIDPGKLWNPIDPDDDELINYVIETPANMVWYLKDDVRLSYEEKEELIKFLTEPTNQEILSKIFKSKRKDWEECKPSYSSAMNEWINKWIENDKITYNGGNIYKLLNKENNQDHNYYQGPNHHDCEGSAIMGLIHKTICKIWGSNDTISDEEIKKFIEEVKGSRFEMTIKKLGPSKEKRSTSVYSSSFTTYYDYDFEVVCTKEGEEIFKETFKNITTGTYFYSGGWD